MTSILDGLVAKFEVGKHDEYPRQLNDIELEVTHPDHGDVASLSAWLILRSRIGDSFHEIMDEDSAELHEFSVTLFDKYMRVKPHLTASNGGLRSGTGCWDLELNRGNVIYIMGYRVNDQHKGKGIESWMLDQLKGQTFVTENDIVIFWPGPGEGQDREIQLFRENGFRRIGRTQFFGFSPNPGHASRKLAAEEDAEALQSIVAPSTLTMEERNERYPLHSAIITTTTEAIVPIIQAAYDKEPASVHEADDNGFRPVYMAAVIARNPFAVDKLLELDVAMDLHNCENASGMDVLEALEGEMESTREFSQTLLPLWGGHSDEHLTLHYKICKAMKKSVGDLELAEYIKRKKFGCTCEKCFEGWLSPRMRFRLTTEAALKRDMMRDCVSDYFSERGATITHDDIAIAVDFIPPSHTTRITKSLYRSFTENFGDVYEAFKVQGPPKLGDLLALTRLGMGHIDWVFDCITHDAQEQSTLGDGTFEELWDTEENTLETDDELKYRVLPECRNDLEFNLVRSQVGLDPRKQWGPYRTWGNDGGDFDEDDDEDD